MICVYYIHWSHVLAFWSVANTPPKKDTQMISWSLMFRITTGVAVFVLFIPSLLNWLPLMYPWSTPYQYWAASISKRSAHLVCLRWSCRCPEEPDSPVRFCYIPDLLSQSHTRNTSAHLLQKKTKKSGSSGKMWIDVIYIVCNNIYDAIEQADNSKWLKFTTEHTLF